MPTPDDVILDATFDQDAIIKYHWIGLLPICIFIVTIPIVLIVAIIYWILLPRIVASWSASLTSRNLLVRKGVFNKVEKTIPLEKITDLSTTEGPIMRMVGLKRIGVETAGQSGAAGASLVSLLGVVDTDGFRARVLEQRDAISAGVTPATDPISEPITAPTELHSITASLERIERVLERIADRPG